MIPRQLLLISSVLLSIFYGSNPRAPPRIFRKYKLVHVATETYRTLPELWFDYRVRKHNRTTPVLDADVVVIDPEKANKLQMWIEGSERLGVDHTYTRSAVGLTCSYCDFLGGKLGFNRGFQDYGNITCPLKKGDYWIRGFIFEDKYLPPAMPGIHWRLDMYIGPPGVKVRSNDTGKLAYYFRVVYL